MNGVRSWKYAPRSQMSFALTPVTVPSDFAPIVM